MKTPIRRRSAGAAILDETRVEGKPAANRSAPPLGVSSEEGILTSCTFPILAPQGITWAFMTDLSKSEWELMLICWDLGAPSAREVHTASLKQKPRDYRTILATLNNIVRKGFLDAEKRPGPRNIPTNHYLPTLSRREGLERRIRKFLTEDLRSERENLGLLRQILDERPG